MIVDADAHEVGALACLDRAAIRKPDGLGRVAS